MCALAAAPDSILLAQSQQPSQSPSQPPAQSQPQSQPPAQAPPRRSDEFRITRDVNLVVLHASVVDEQGRFVSDLKQGDFRVYEDRVEQKLSLVQREDIPVTVGLVIDNSASMRDKRARVNKAALTFVETSNRLDEMFVVNFSDDYYLDQDKDFTSDINELKEALERIDSRGTTALYDAIIGSLDHLKKGKLDKHVLIVVTDGEDNASQVGRGRLEAPLELTTLEAQKSDALIYTIGLLDKEETGTVKRAKRALVRLSATTGGQAFFPASINEVESICRQIAHDIRNQYTLAYYPSNTKRDGSFRAVNVEVASQRGRGKLSVRTRTGYFAQRAASTGGQ